MNSLRTTVWVASLCAIVCVAEASRARADVFDLKDGGQLVGALVEKADNGTYIVRTADGAVVTLERKQLRRVEPQDEVAAEYARRSRSAADTAEAHRELAKWCRENKLSAEADHHLQRVVDLDPNDEEARASLGFQRQGKRWLTRDDSMREHGMIMFDGTYRTPQDIAIRQRDGTIGDGEAHWFRDVKLWRGWLASRREDRVQAAQVEFANLNDPAAAPALIGALKNEPDDWAFGLLLATLGRLDHPAAIQTLVGYSLDYEHQNNRTAAAVRQDCLEYLLAGERAVSIVPYVTALKSKENEIVNRAGEALGRIGDPAAISPLIDALVTEHRVMISAGTGGQTSASMDPSGQGGGSFSFGGSGPQFSNDPFENSAVLAALKKLSGGENFDYDEAAWRRWYIDLLMREHTNARRDE